MNDFSITMPCGQIKILMSIPRMIDHFAREVVRREVVEVGQIAQSSSASLGHPLPVETAYSKRAHKLLPFYGKESLDQYLQMTTRDSFKEHHDEVLKAFLSDRFKLLVTQKKTEFYVPNLNIEKVEELAFKYMDSFGSENAVMMIFKLSEYHKFASIVDVESAFRIFLNEDYQAELVEMAPSKWVLGRYGEDLTLIKEMESMRRYSF